MNLVNIARTENFAVANSGFDGRVVHYDAGKAGVRSITAEGAIFKGGKALKSLRSASTQVALAKALNGRFRAAAEIIACGVPASFTTGFEKFVGPCHANKSVFSLFCDRVLAEEPKPGKGWNEKQMEARELAAAYLELTAPAKEEGEVVGEA